MRTVFLLLLAATALSLHSCKKETLPDPTGTITVSLNYTAPDQYFTLYQGVDLHSTTNVHYCTSRLSIDNANLNFQFTSIAALDPNIVQWTIISPNFGGEIADVGSVKGLAEVTAKPSAGWASKAALEVGHGYVCRYRAAYDYAAATELPYMYTRVYVDSWLKNSGGSIIGAKVKYLNNF